MHYLDEKEALETLNFFTAQLEQGNIYAAYIDDTTDLTEKDFTCFNNAYDAQEYCYEHSTDFDIMTFSPTTSFQRELELIT